MDLKTPRVSIGMPVFNGERYLAKAIDSILEQDFTDFELIISDNASTDNTQNICRDYAARDFRIKYHRMSENIGAAGNYNHVFAMSKGTYFKWAAHDDVILPGYLSACLAEYDLQSKRSIQPSIVHTKSMVINDSGNVIHGDSIVSVSSRRPAMRVLKLLPNLGANAVFGLIRRDALEQTRLIGNYLFSDYPLLVELTLIGSIIQVDEVLFYRRVHKGMSTRANRDRKSLLSWFDPNAKSRRTDKVRYLGEYFRSVWRSNAVGPIDRATCLTTLTVGVALISIHIMRVKLGRYRRLLTDQLEAAHPGRQR